jgi:cobalt/nickel transport system permease protein
MRHDFLDSHSRLDSPIHRLPAGLKLAGALVIVILLVLLPLSVGAWLAVALVAVAVLSRLPWSFLWKRLLWLEPFVIGVAVLALFQPGGGKVFVTIVARSTLSLFTMILLSSTTPFSELLRVLRRVRVPGLLVTTLALMYRYLFVLVEEAERMQRARTCRTFERRRWHGWKALGTVAGQLFVRSTERAERIYAAMLARGWK